MYLGLSRAHFLSPTGQCKPFDTKADGYCRAEGCGLVVLKKLSQARAEGDDIYGVIRGVGINQCGTAKSITHPDHETQASLMSTVLHASNVSPDTIDVVEAHGTGTQAGDFAEASSLSTVFKGRSSGHPLHIGSVKGNIGHAEAASGVAGLIKLLLMLKNNSIPRQASFESLNPRLDFIADHNMVVAQTSQQWKSTNGNSRRALLNNFGAAGSNAALVLEESPRDTTQHTETRQNPCSLSWHLLAISGKSASAIERSKSQYAAYIQKNPHAKIEDVCYTTNARRQHHEEFRWTARGINMEALLSEMQRTGNPGQRVVSSKPKKTVFIFSGQGGAHRGMGSELLRTSPIFRTAVEECDAILHRHGFPMVRLFLDPETPGSDLPMPSKLGKAGTIVVQCACFVLQYALTRLLAKLGVSPDLVLGHR